MNIINTSLSANTLYFSLTENGFASNTEAQIQLTNRYDNTDMVIILSANTDASLYPNRINKFNLLSEQYSGLTTGVYQYEILQADVSLEVGLLKVVDTTMSIEEQVIDSSISLPYTSSDDDIITYRR